MLKIIHTNPLAKLFNRWARHFEKEPDLDGHLHGILHPLFTPASLKKRLIPVYMHIFMLAFFINAAGFSQPMKRNEVKEIYKNWAVNVSGGLTSYYGDLSTHDDMFFGKLQYESGPAASIMIEKELGRIFSVTGQVITGNILSQKQNVSFESRIFEYNIQGRINIVELFSNHRIYRRVGLMGFVGVGNFLFYTQLHEHIDGLEKTIRRNARVPEFVYFAGGGISYDMSSRITLAAHLSIRQCQNDYLDNLVQNNNFDYYSYLNVGVTYRIFNLKGKSIKENDKLLGWGRSKPIYRPNLRYD